MREIKFRAWDKISNQFVRGGFGAPLVIDMGGYLRKTQTTMSDTILLGTYRGDSSKYALQQYTGLKDKNGVEIYEGDIVEGGFDDHRGIVAFGMYANPFNSDEWTGYQGFYIKWDEERSQFTRGDIGYWLSKGMETAITVIGNIYQHPELLNEPRK